MIHNRTTRVYDRLIHNMTLSLKCRSTQQSLSWMWRCILISLLVCVYLQSQICDRLPFSGTNSRLRHWFKGKFLKPKRTRHMLPTGFKKFRIHNLNNREYCGEVAHGVSSKKRKEIVQRAQHLAVHLTNPSGRMRSQGNE